MSLNFNLVGCALLIILINILIHGQSWSGANSYKSKIRGHLVRHSRIQRGVSLVPWSKIFFSKWEEKKAKRKKKKKKNGNLVTRGDLGPLSGHPPALKPTIIASNHITANFTTPTSIHLIN